MNQGWVIRGRVNYWVAYQILGEVLSKKVEFLIESGEKKLKMGLGRIFIWLWTINGRKHQYLSPIRLYYYLPYWSKIQVLNSTPSRLSACYSAYYSTPNIGHIVVLFRKAKRGWVICRSWLQYFELYKYYAQNLKNQPTSKLRMIK